MSATYEQTSSPQETQFAGVLQMGVQELRDYVETALQENPVFELSDPGEEMLEDPNFARKREWLEAGDWQDSYYQGQDEEDGSRDPLSRMGYYLSDENDLSRFVLSQFIGTKLEPEVLQAVELLCDRLDDDGFLSEDPAELAASLGVSDAVISRALTELQAADPEAAAAIHPNNQVRVLRALEHFRATGKRLSEQKAQSLPPERPYRSLVLGLDFPDRTQLYRRIDLRVDKMLDAGLLDEAKLVYDHRQTYRTAAQAIGYKEFFPYFEGTAPLDACTEKLKQASRNYAKRQLTWFRHMDGVVWLDASAPDVTARAVQLTQEFLAKG